MKRKITQLTIAMVCLTLLGGCANVSPGEENSFDKQDPLESYNRKVFTLNRKVDEYFFRPVAVGYDYVLPDFVENRVDDFFDNLNQIPTIANDILQFDVYYIFNDTWRLAVNTTAGVGGLFDVAEEIGLKEHHQDFGMTMARWGYQPSSYFVIPLLGPSTVRDAMGSVVNTGMSVWPYIDPLYVSYSLYAVKLVNIRAQDLDADKLIEQAFDPYVFVRNAYLQHRQQLIESDDQSGDTYIPGIDTSQSPTFQVQQNTDAEPIVVEAGDANTDSGQTEAQPDQQTKQSEQ